MEATTRTAGGTVAAVPLAVRAMPSRRRRRAGIAGWVAWAYLAPVIAYLGAFYAYPLYRNVDLSLRHYTVRSFVQGGAPFSGWDNFRQVVNDPTFDTALRNTMVFTFVSILFQYVLGLALAVFFNRGFRLAPTLRALFLIPWLLPLIVSASTWSWMLNSESGVINYGLHFIGIGPV